ncbi:MAG: TIGR04255 family protein [Deltaproteobacteria bacterium]|jgi:uncharacterized protein (TIGR04255 family)|nr:TIGR04255 family protein [Deltaproteobacteria bacterium]
MHYKSNYITDAIINLDLIEDFTDSIVSIPQDFFSIYQNLSIHKEIQSVNTRKLNFDIDGKINNYITETVHELHCFSNDRSVETIISPQYLAIKTKKYTTFDDFKAPLPEIVNYFTKKFNKFRPRKLTLRYIDQIKIPENISSSSWHSFWSDYINEDLLNNLNFLKGNDKKLSRQLNTIIWNHDDSIVRFTFGINNSNYPSPNKDKTFILDTEIFSIGLIELNELNSSLDIFKDKAVEIFEKSITDLLRDKMGREDE